MANIIQLCFSDIMLMNKTLFFVFTYPWSIYIVLSMDFRNVSSKNIETKQQPIKTIYETNECGEVFNAYQCSYINRSIQKYIKTLESKFRLSKEKLDNEYNELHHGHDKHLKTNHARKAKSQRLFDNNIKNKELKNYYRRTNVHRSKVRYKQNLLKHRSIENDEV